MANEKKEVKALLIDYTFKTSVGSVSGGDSPIPNLVTVKKVAIEEGKTIPYISAQMLKHCIRVGWEERGEKLSEPVAPEKAKGVPTSQCKPLEFIDDDLLGFMFEEKKRRTAPVRMSPAHGSLLYYGDKDYGTHPTVDKEGNRVAGNIFETEIYYNYFTGSVLIELDRIGRGREPIEQFNNEECKIEEKRRRVVSFLEVFRHLWGGGRQTRFLTDISPKFAVISFVTTKIPFLLEILKVDGEGNINVDDVKKVIDGHNEIIVNKVVGLSPAIFANEEDVKNKLGAIDIQQAFTEAINTVNNLEFGEKVELTVK